MNEYITYVRSSTPAQLRAAQAYRDKNRDTINEKMRDYYQRNKDEILYKKKVVYHDKRRQREIQRELEAMYAAVILPARPN